MGIDFRNFGVAVPFEERLQVRKPQRQFFFVPGSDFGVRCLQIFRNAGSEGFRRRFEDFESEEEAGSDVVVVLVGDQLVGDFADLVRISRRHHHLHGGGDDRKAGSPDVPIGQRGDLRPFS